MGVNANSADSALPSSSGRNQSYTYSNHVSLERHLLQVWDGLSVFITGTVCACFYTAMKQGVSAIVSFDDTFIPVAMRISIVACLLAPVVFKPVRIIARSGADWLTLLMQVALQTGILISLLLAIGFLTRALIYVPREWVVAWTITIYFSVACGRLLVSDALSLTAPHALLRPKVVVAGKRCAADALLSHLRTSSGNNSDIVKVFYDDVESDSRDGYIDELIAYGKQHRVSQVLLALGEVTETRWLERIVGRLKALDADIALCPYLISAANFELRLGHLGAVPLVLLATRPLGRKNLLLKAFVDKVLSVLLLIAIFPLMVIIAITIRLDSPGPVFFRQRRLGLNNVEFEIFKFRTMASTGNDASDGRWQTRRRDARVTRVGHFLRRSSLDELPQLFNVLRGEMSLVGPRPHPIRMRTEDRLGSEIVADYPHRHRVKPGITGWAQINGYRGATHTVDQIKRRVEYDIFYIENWSIFFDLKILALTPITMIFNNENAF
jgi:Undecaprenyl-phosphate glucose phosphotransferase